jgi:hypothetical protein
MIPRAQAACDVIAWTTSAQFEESLNVTTLEQTAFDCMRTAEFPRALAIADALVKLSGRSSTDLCYRFLKNHRGAKGVRHAARTLLYANARSDNGGESPMLVAS